MKGLIVELGDNASFKCEIDISCIVDNIEWFHKSNEGIERLIKRESISGQHISFFGAVGYEKTDRKFRKSSVCIHDSAGVNESTKTTSMY